MADALEDLHTALVDAQNGYVTAAREAEDPALRRFFDDMAAWHEAAHGALRRALEARGRVADEDGSLMSTVHAAVISVRAAVLGLDEASLASFASGEERILGLYDEALRETSTDLAVARILAAQRHALARRVEEMKRRAESASATTV
jgi:uncharacterized protein (TIGR02284 family)